MQEYQLTIHDDMTSTLVFGSTSPQEVTDNDSDFTPNTFVRTHHIKIPNWDFIAYPSPVFKFTEDRLTEAFVIGNLGTLKGMSKSIHAVEPGGDLVEVNPEFPELIEIEANITRSKRNTLLMESDWTQAADTPLTDDVKALWATYRTNLRDLSGNNNWPFLEDADWPTKP
jgi:hypothetical protein